MKILNRSFWLAPPDVLPPSRKEALAQAVSDLQALPNSSPAAQGLLTNLSRGRVEPSDLDAAADLVKNVQAQAGHLADANKAIAETQLIYRFIEQQLYGDE